LRLVKGETSHLGAKIEQQGWLRRSLGEGLGLGFQPDPGSHLSPLTTSYKVHRVIISGQHPSLTFQVVTRHAAHIDLALSEIIVYSGSILVIVFEVTGHQVALQVAFPTSHSFPFHYCNFGGSAD
jgi:hypothetical protein